MFSSQKFSGNQPQAQRWSQASNSLKGLSGLSPGPETASWGDHDLSTSQRITQCFEDPLNKDAPGKTRAGQDADPFANFDLRQ